MKRLLIATIGLCGLGAIALWAASSVSAATRTVSVVDDAYVDAVSSNSTTTIAVGDTVQWNWSGSNQHTVTSTSGEVFDSGAPQTTGTFSHTFNAVGSFNYICGVHGTAMTGTVVVQAAQAPTNTPQPTNTPASQATNTPASSASSTPGGPTAVATTAPGSSSPTSAAPTPPSGSPAPSGTQSAGESLPSAGTGSGSDSFPWATIASLALIAGLAVAAAAAYRIFRRPEL